MQPGQPLLSSWTTVVSPAVCVKEDFKALSSEGHNSCTMLMHPKPIDNKPRKAVPRITYNQDRNTALEAPERKTTTTLSTTVLPVQSEKSIYIQDTTCSIEAWKLLQGFYQQSKPQRDQVPLIPDFSNYSIPMTTSLAIEPDSPTYTAWVTTDLLMVLVLLSWLPSQQRTVYKALYRWAIHMWDNVVSRLEEWKESLKPRSSTIDEDEPLEKMCAQKIYTDTPSSDLETDDGVYENRPMYVIFANSRDSFLDTELITFARTPPPASPAPSEVITVVSKNTCLKITTPDPEDELVSLFSAWHLQTPTATESPSSALSSALVDLASCSVPMSLS